jgi:hypothetical protein
LGRRQSIPFEREHFLRGSDSSFMIVQPIPSNPKEPGIMMMITASPAT